MSPLPSIGRRANRQVRSARRTTSAQRATDSIRDAASGGWLTAYLFGGSRPRNGPASKSARLISASSVDRQLLKPGTSQAGGGPESAAWPERPSHGDRHAQKRRRDGRAVGVPARIEALEQLHQFLP